MKLTQPKIYCKKCGDLIPDNMDIATLSAPNGATEYKSYSPRIGCEKCAIAACPPKPKTPGLKRGQVAAEQTRFEGPTIYID